MSQPSFFERTNAWVRKSITIRLITITILILLLLIPIEMIESLIREREYRQEEAISEVSAKWGHSQTVVGLVLTVPYRTMTKVYDDDEPNKYRMVATREFAHFLPDELQINGELQSEIRYRGIYEVVLYNSELELRGVFSHPTFEELSIRESAIYWEDAYISLGLSDLRSIQESVTLKWNDNNYEFNPGVESNDIIGSGISTRIPMSAVSSDSNYKFSVGLNFNGSSSLTFTPLGRTTNVKLKSDWKSPSFEGAFLPDERVISDSGFTSEWEILHLNRTYPQKFKGRARGVESSSFGVDLFVPLDEYQKSMRAAKYAVIFITLTFLVFFFVQVLNGVRIHPIQYIMVGLALCVFYTLLIALSEHIAFNISYLIASIAIIGLITVYAKSVFKNRQLTGIIAGILILLYIFIYSIIQMEDYALLMGSIGLFLALSAAMYLSRKVDWYGLKTSKEE